MDTRELFARIIRCEAGGEGDSGMRAVATCTMNRTRTPHGEYKRLNKGSLRKVIEQQCQYACHKSKINGIKNTQNIWKAAPDPVHYRIADEAISGYIFSPIGNKTLWYLNPFKKTCPAYFPYNQSGKFKTKVNRHCFYTETHKYRTT